MHLSNLLSTELDRPNALNERIVEAILRVFVSFADWFPVNEALEGTPRLWALLCRCMKTPSHAAAKLAAEFFLVVVSRKLKVDDRALVLTLFEHVPSMMEGLAVQVGGVASEDDAYAFQKRLCMVLVTLGTQQLLSERRLVEPPCFDAFARSFSYSCRPFSMTTFVQLPDICKPCWRSTNMTVNCCRPL